MPSDVQLTPPARMVDPRGQRFGAGLSVVVLAFAFAFGLPWVVALVAIALAVSSVFGTRYFLLGRPWPFVRRVLRLAPPRELEHEYPPRFAQALGSIGLVLATLLLVLGSPVGWLFVGAVAGLQALLALTGYCLGCRLYFLRWWVPSQFARLISRGTVPAAGLPRTSLRSPEA